MVKKELVSTELIKSIVARYGSENATLKDLRLATMCILSFAGLFRSKELLNIRVRDMNGSMTILWSTCLKVKQTFTGEDKMSL